MFVELFIALELQWKVSYTSLGPGFVGATSASYKASTASYIWALTSFLLLRNFKKVGPNIWDLSLIHI